MASVSHFPSENLVYFSVDILHFTVPVLELPSVLGWLLVVYYTYVFYACYVIIASILLWLKHGRLCVFKVVFY